ncbi:MAG: aminoacyl-tRNA hydrolase [Cardiobacteriaceae bacterium]|nr:aminoacyl-tRNA hydrolase [Cardiobacteriaceae bacterium]
MIKLIVGLGNPGERYQKTRHNAGFWLLDALAAHAGERFRDEKKYFGEYARIAIGHQPVHLLKPQTYMNASGRAVAALANFYNLASDDILVAHDELDLPEGSVKLKQGGGHGGHNGLRDIIKALDSRDFYRLRIGIDHPGDKNLVVDYVLHPPGKDGLISIEHAIRKGENILPVLLKDGAEKAMHQLHSA